MPMNLKQVHCMAVILASVIWSLTEGTTGDRCGCQDIPPRDCFDLLERGQENNGVYVVYPVGYKQGIQVYCDMETSGGGWLVFQRRKDGSVDFYRDWHDYQVGFGDIDGEFWLEPRIDTTQLSKRPRLSNYFLHSLTNQGLYELRVDLEDFENETRYAYYQHFRIGDGETKYQLSISGYQGDAGDAMFATHNGMKFTTKDQDNDTHDKQCAVQFKGAWWYNKCHSSNLNGEYKGGAHTSYADGVNWYQWKGHNYSLKLTEMKIRPL